MTYYADYCSFMSDIISMGYARKLYDEFKDEDGRAWYLVPAASWDLPPAKFESTIVRPRSNGTPWMTNFFSDMSLLVTWSVFLPDSGRRGTPLWRTSLKCSFKWELKRKIKISTGFCGRQVETCSRNPKSFVWPCTSSVSYHPLHVPTMYLSVQQTTTKRAMEPRYPIPLEGTFMWMPLKI